MGAREWRGAAQSQTLTHVVALLAERGDEYVRLDAATRRNLELTETLRGTPAPTLFSEIDVCASGMGSRLLRHWVHHPLRDRAALGARHEAVDALCGASGTGPYLAAHAVLKRCADIERIAARIALKSARPRELAALRDSLALLTELAAGIAPLQAPLLVALRAALAPPETCLDLLRRAVAEEPAAMVRDGGVIATGYSAELDELRALQANAGDFLVALEVRERERTGIPNLPVLEPRSLGEAGHLPPARPVGHAAPRERWRCLGGQGDGRCRLPVQCPGTSS